MNTDTKTQTPTQPQYWIDLPPGTVLQKGDTYFLVDTTTGKQGRRLIPSEYFGVTLTPRHEPIFQRPVSLPVPRPADDDAALLKELQLAAFRGAMANPKTQGSVDFVAQGVCGMAEAMLKEMKARGAK